MNRRTLSAFTIALTLAAGTALAASAFASELAPPTDEQVSALIEKIQGIKNPADTKDRAKMQEASKARAEAISQGIKDISLAEASLNQIERFYSTRVLATNNDATKTMFDRLGELAKASGAPGARAAEIRIAMMPAPAAPPADADRAKLTQERTAARNALVEEAFNHPGMAELVKSGKGDIVIGGLAAISGKVLVEKGMVAKVETMLADGLSLEAAASLRGLVSKVASGEIVLEKPQRVAFLDKVAAAVDGAVTRAGTVSETRAPIAKRATDVAKQARSSFARGEFIDHTAPEIAFEWSSDGKLKSLSELKGNVVVVDFWATWCGPCIGSFPKIRDFTARYEGAGYPVRILGVTSLQGYHMKRSLDTTVKPERIDTKGDPAKEFALMPGYMKDMDITWTVTFSPDGCFNPNYGVNGIPHIAIIDPAGKVRYNELRPHTPEELKDFADKIDALLKEANLKAPEPYAAPVKEEKKVSSTN